MGNGGAAVYGAGADLSMFRGGMYLGGYPMAQHWIPPYPILQPAHLPAHPIDPVSKLKH